jgi:hypothetical protein
MSARMIAPTIDAPMIIPFLAAVVIPAANFINLKN